MVRPGAGRMAFADAESRLAGPASRLPATVLAAGGDDFLRERLVLACRAGADAEGAEFQRLEGDALDAETLMGALATLSLFGEARRVWIRETSKMDRRVEEALLSWTEDPGEGVFVLVTTAREPGDLKFLESLAAKSATVACSLKPGEGIAWALRLAADERLRLPEGTVEALYGAAGDLLSYRQELRKLALHADAEGRVPPSALDALRGARVGGSVDRWASAVLAGTAAAARAESQALAAEGIGGTSAMWAIAERALGALEPQSFAFRRTTREGPSLPSRTARAVLDAVYRADRALKRGEIRDFELVDRLVQTVRQAIRG